MPDSIQFLGYQKKADSKLFSLNKFSELIERYSEMGYQAVQGLAYPPDKPANLVDINTARQNFLTQLKNSQSVISHNFWKPTFEFDVGLDNNSHAMWAVGTTYEDLGPYSSLSKQELYSQSFIDVIKAAIEIYQPYYGCIFDGIRDIPSPASEELSEVSEIYEVNFFSFELIECCLNEQLLLSAPAWKIEKLDCGNLLVPSLQAIYSEDEASLNLVAKHLGLR
jgi:hypothetical protein